MTSEERFVELWNDYLEGELGESGIEELRLLVSGDDRLLQTAADSYQIHRLLGLIGQDSTLGQNDFVSETLARLPADQEHFVDGVMQAVRQGSDGKGTRGRLLSSKWPVLMATAALIAVIASVVFLQAKASHEIVQITELNGSLRWTGNGGQVISDLEVGRSLEGGTLESVSADSWVNLRFRDGSMVTISGRSLVTISEHRQKELHLYRGGLSASVAPQPEDKPMLIHTPTARLEVLGTQLNVEAELSSTTLSVNEGLVRVKRLADGSVVEVPAEHQVVASIERDGKLNVTRRPESVGTWQSNLATDKLHGKWLPASGDNNDVLRTAPMLWGDPEKPVTLYAVSLGVSRNRPNPVLLNSGARFRIRGRIIRSGKVFFGLTTRHINGGFSGKFLIERDFEVVEETGRFVDIELCLEDFRPQEKELTDKHPELFPGSPVGLELFDWWCCTINEDAGLEIKNVELDAGVVEGEVNGEQGLKM
jgi:hypothetical protein